MANVDEIPIIELYGEVLGLGRESEKWKALIKKVREAFEEYGCFIVEYDKIPIELQEELFNATKMMFDLPQEKKHLYKKPSHRDGGYVVSNPFVPLYESFGVYGDHEVRAFEKLMWPEGKPGFCEVLQSVNAKMLELNLLILRMTFESFGLGEYYQSKDLDHNIIGNLRAMKYKVPKENEQGIGLHTHIDKTILTILCQNSVQGLEALSPKGNWITLNVPKGGLVIIAGDAIEVWSNGRLKPLKHKVVMSGDKERYSCGFFSIPNDGVTIEVPEDLVDKDHPPLYRPFVYSEYLLQNITNVNMDALQVYAGV
ncbi:2-oxoglutarate-dependent dioxygenase AOP1 [Actinidia chinensis var. chinensis]|uniref:2-oxoglutarate-dependent dioxygenase DAO n=1 Tax=Actinidia chinensis var. chinensis TaxID=1590841 RepID=A0A2R6QCH0_ACTCC|nr:2-oxoglutarate-dependent dioxygenase AOP1 [Actinidia chinensis var. chinensis]